LLLAHLPIAHCRLGDSSRDSAIAGWVIHRGIAASAIPNAQMPQCPMRRSEFAKSPIRHR
jgi:hypothetical protein